MSGEQINAMKTVMIQRMLDSAGAAGKENGALYKILETMGMLDHLRSTVIIDADITRFKMEMQTVLAILKAMPRTDTMRGEYEQQYGDLKRLIESLGREKVALDSANESMTKIKDLTAEQAAADKKLQKQKDVLKEKILSLVNTALDKEQKKLDEITAKLEAMVSATKDAIMGQYNFANALTTAKEKAQVANDELQILRDEMNAYSDVGRDAINTTLSFADALSQQTSATNDLKEANNDLISAQTDMNDANTEYANIQQTALDDIASAEEAYLTAHGRKARREALENYSKVQTKAYEDVAKAAEALVPVQQKLADATNAATSAQSAQMSFLERLQAQALKAKGFASQLEQLIGLGLSKEAMAQIVSAGADTGSAMAKELIDGGSVAVGQTNDLFKEIAEVSKKAGVDLSENYFKIGKNVGVDFVAALTAQAGKVTKFNEKVRELLAAGFRPEAIQEVLNAGIDAGTEIADALLLGGTVALNESTRIFDSLKMTADDLSKLLGDSFYQTGVDLGQKIVDGLKLKLKELNDTLGDMDVPQLQDVLGKLPTAVTGIISAPAGAVAGKDSTGLFGSFMEAVRKQHPNFYGLRGDTPVKDAKENFPKLYAQYKAAGRAMSLGGFVQSPVQALIGESGPEVVMPLDRFDRMYGGKGDGGTTITLNIQAGFGAGGKDIGDAIVNELIRYQRRNGKIPVKTL